MVPPPPVFPTTWQDENKNVQNVVVRIKNSSAVVHRLIIEELNRGPNQSPMGTAVFDAGGGDSEAAFLLTGSIRSTIAAPNQVPKDSFHLAYIIYFTLGVGYLLPWNAFITAVDYFSYLYPDANVDRTFAVVYMLVGLLCLVFIVLYAHKSDSYVRINVGLGLFMLALLVVPVMDAVYIKGRVGLYDGFYVTVGATALSGLADALVQAGVIGSAGELPERYMQAVVAGTAGSGE